MAAQMKDYAYSDNADVLKDKVNAGKPVQKNNGNITVQTKGNITAQMKDINPPNPLARDTSRATLQAKSQEMRAQLAAKKKSDGPIVSRSSASDRSQFAQDVNSAAGAIGNAFKSIGSWADDGIKNLANTPFMPGTKDYLFGTQKSTLDKEGARLAAASNSNTFKGSSLQGTGNNPVFQPGTSTNTVPSKLIGAQQEAGTSRFDKSKLTLGNNPYTGQVGMFKNGEMISNQDAATALGQKGKGQFLGKFSAPVGGVTDFTSLFANDINKFKTQMAAINNGTDASFYTGHNHPGGGTYGADSHSANLSQRRAELVKQLDDHTQRNSAFSMGTDLKKLIANKALTAPIRDEIKHIDEQILGKNDLANKIQQELIRIQAGANEQNIRNQGAIDAQNIAGNYGLIQQRLQNEGSSNTARIGASAELMKEALGGKAPKFGDTKDSFIDKNAIELQRKQAETLYQSQIEAGKNHTEALKEVMASFPDLYQSIDDDEKKVEGV